MSTMNNTLATHQLVNSELASLELMSSEPVRSAPRIAQSLRPIESLQLGPRRASIRGWEMVLTTTVDDNDLIKSLSLPDGSSTSPSGTTKAQLDLLFLGLECLAGESSEATLAAAKELNLSQWVSDRVNLWRLRNASPLRRSTGGRKKIDIDEARALVHIICYLARQHQPKIRAAITALEAAITAERSPYQEPGLADYLDEFHSHYRSRMIDGDFLTSDSITEIGLRILVELLFYGSRRGPARLWVALLNRPPMELPPGEEDDDSPEQMPVLDQQQ